MTTTIFMNGEPIGECTSIGYELTLTSSLPSEAFRNVESKATAILRMMPANRRFFQELRMRSDGVPLHRSWRVCKRRWTRLKQVQRSWVRRALGHHRRRWWEANVAFAEESEDRR